MNGQSSALNSIDILKRNHLFRDLPDDLLEAIAAESSEVRIVKSEILCHAGDPAESMYVIVTGRLNITVEAEDGHVIQLSELSDNDNIGEIALFTGYQRTATMTALTDSTLLAIPMTTFVRKAASHGSVADKLMAIAQPRLRRTRLAIALQQLMGVPSQKLIDDLYPKLEWRKLLRDEVLFQQGEPGTDMYIVVSGRMRASVSGDNGDETILGEVEVGDTVGEMGTLTGERRSATVTAVRETLLAKLSKDVFESLIIDNPEAMLHVTRGIIRRQQQITGIVSGSAALADSANSLNIVIVPLDKDIDTRQFSQLIQQELAGLGTTLVLDADGFDAMYGQEGAAQSGTDTPINMLLVDWMMSKEIEYDYVVYIADPDESNWTQRCVEQAERLLLVGRGSGSPEIRRVEQWLSEKYPSLRTELVLLHTPDTSFPSGTANWLNIRSVHAHHHVRGIESEHYGRMARRITGKAVGLVLGGGGARGLAHVGVIRALQEANIPVDMIGGTSMGALVAAAYACHSEYEKLTAIAGNLSSRSKILDYTLPFVALTSSSKVNNLLKQIYGDQLIEDLWIPFFCVSTNLSMSMLNIDRMGLLRDAVRSSIAIPAVFTPVMRDNCVTVDGSVMNNFPVDIMSKMVEGGTVVGSIVTQLNQERPARGFDFTNSISGWSVLANRLNPFSRRKRLPSLMGTMMRTLDVNSISRMRESRNIVDLLIEVDLKGFGILDFNDYIEIIQAGYTSAEPMIAAWQQKAETDTEPAAPTTRTRMAVAVVGR